MEAINDLRCERKFLVSELLAKEIEEVILLHPALFSTIYYERFINNIYFDNLEFLSFHENQSGTTPRKKIRIRWYGDLSENIKEPVLEIKRKFGIVGRKDFYSLPDLCFRNFLSKLETLDMIKNAASFEDFKKELVLLAPTLINRYKRKYFLSADGHYRITLDSNISFFSVSSISSLISENEFCEPYNVLELKYNHTKDAEASRVTNHFPFRLTKSSKYVLGILKLSSSGW